jgi:hypothetical protein
MVFAKWMDLLDDSCTSDTEMKIHDLPEFSFYMAYNEGYTPEQFRSRSLPIHSQITMKSENAA